MCLLCLSLPTDSAPVRPARCEWLLPAGPAALLQPAAPASAAPGTVSVAGAAEVPGSAGKRRPLLPTIPVELGVKNWSV